MRRADITPFFERLQAANPEPVTELAFRNEFTLLVAIVLSAQSTDAGVNRATRGLFEQADSPEAMLALGEAELKRHIRTLGLFNSKAKNIMALCQLLVEQHGGKVPETREELEALPGVGRKTANVWLNCARGKETFAVDTHVFRVCNRTGLAKGKTPAQVEAGLEKAVPAAFRLHAHHWLILHGRYICKAQRPRCADCVVYEFCGWKEKAAFAAGFNTTKKGTPKRPSS